MDSRSIVRFGRPSAKICVVCTAHVLGTAAIGAAEVGAHKEAYLRDIQALEYEHTSCTCFPVTQQTRLLCARPVQQMPQNGHVEIAKMLLAAGAERVVTNKHGETAHDIAIARTHAELQSLLEDELYGTLVALGSVVFS